MAHGVTKSQTQLSTHASNYLNEAKQQQQQKTASVEEIYQEHRFQPYNRVGSCLETVKDSRTLSTILENGVVTLHNDPTVKI